MNIIEAAEMTHWIYDEICLMKARFGDVQIEIYVTREFAFRLKRVTAEDGYVYKAGPTGDIDPTLWGCPCHEILEHRTEKPYRVVVTGGTG